MSTDKKWMHLTLVDDAGEEIGWLGADFTSTYGATNGPGIKLTEAQMRVLAKRLLGLLGDEEES